ncbi:MAG TPA: hypothetical protein VEL31_20365 [Ktedonobacteraceae bacterium]|nr:hypothetical protein [Ktedonobacteraceae bacterium]
MPKKTATTRGGAQRNKPRVKVQKSFELVRQVSDEQEQEQEPEAVSSAEPTAVSVSTMVAPEIKENKSKSKRVASSEVKQSESTSSDSGTVTAPKGSAAARLAARRHGVQKAQQRAAATLITAEHYAYVRRDLVFIAILAVIMFSAIIILHFVPGIGS